MRINIFYRVCCLQQQHNFCNELFKRSFMCAGTGTDSLAVEKRRITSSSSAGYNSALKKTESEVSYSRFSANKIMTGPDTFRLSDYDCIGFDLDNTVLRYNVGNMVRLAYDIKANFLVDKKGYSPKHLLKPMDVDFLQKGLLIDFHRGNIIKIGPDGYIHKASHGTKKLTDDQIVAQYGPERKWDVSTEYSQNFLSTWNGPLSERLRTVLDYFDINSTLLFARIVDTLDEKSGKQADIYNIWNDVLDGLVYMYSREHFEKDMGGYFPALKKNPEKYILKTPDNVLKWLKQLKSEKTTFLITGSHIDFANFTATYALGADWRDYFDSVICYAKKPGFFIGGKPFVMLDGASETRCATGSDLKFKEIYSQGNWRDLSDLLHKKVRSNSPKFLYVGDNLIQDIYTPSTCTKCDTIAILEEMSAEGMKESFESHTDTEIICSNYWGPYFAAGQGEDSIWADLIRKHSKICIPALSSIADNPLDHVYNSFTENQRCNKGYYPSEPLHLVKRQSCSHFLSEFTF